MVSPPAKADALEMLPGRETPCPFPFPGCGVCPLITLFSCKRIEKIIVYHVEICVLSIGSTKDKTLKLLLVSIRIHVQN